MPNRRSTKKALRASLRKKEHNAGWKHSYKEATKAVRDGIMAKTATSETLKTGLVSIQKLCDKAAKEKVIHKNKANRIKSRYAKRIAVYLAKTTGETKADKPARKSRKTSS